MPSWATFSAICFQTLPVSCPLCFLSTWTTFGFHLPLLRWTGNTTLPTFCQQWCHLCVSLLFLTCLLSHCLMVSPSLAFPEQRCGVLQWGTLWPTRTSLWQCLDWRECLWALSATSHRTVLHTIMGTKYCSVISRLENHELNQLHCLLWGQWFLWWGLSNRLVPLSSNACFEQVVPAHFTFLSFF